MLEIYKNIRAIKRALEVFTHHKYLILGNQYNYPKCKMKVDMGKSLSVFEAPRLLYPALII